LVSPRRILITGVSSPSGGRLAQLLERSPQVQAIIGVDRIDPRHELERTEFVRVDTDPTLLRRILGAAAIDTVIDTRLVVDPQLVPRDRAREINIDGTHRLLAACGSPGSPVRRLVFSSSAHCYGAHQNDPAFFTESMVRQTRPHTAIERDVLDAEAAVGQFTAAHPEATVTVVRFADAIGGELRSSHLTLLNLPVVPAILGFDPRFQFIHHDDFIAVLAHAALNDLPGVYNAAGDGVLAFSEVASLLGKPLLPVLPPWGTLFAATTLRRLGVPAPVEMLRQLRFGRGLDNRRLKASGFSYRYTTREAVLKLRAQQRLRPLLGSGGSSYRYEREVEEFLRRSPSVQPPVPSGGQSDQPPADGDSYDGLSEDELIGIISSLETGALRRLREYEAAHRRRQRVLQAFDHCLERRAAQRPG
jgi:UDP-glucose 4-epimerase